MEIPVRTLFVVDGLSSESGALDLGGDRCAESRDDLFRICTQWSIVAAGSGGAVVLAANPERILFNGEFCDGGLFQPAKWGSTVILFDVGEQHRDSRNFFERGLFYLTGKLKSKASELLSAEIYELSTDSSLHEGTVILDVCKANILGHVIWRWSRVCCSADERLKP